MQVNLYPFQKQAIENAAGKNRVAFFHDMGLGKTFTGAEKMRQLGAPVNLVVCQKSKVQDWINLFDTYYKGDFYAFDCTDLVELGYFMLGSTGTPVVGVINYDLIFRRKELLELKDFTLLLDESSLIQNEKRKRSKFILRMEPANVILLSGTPTGGKYEKLWSQMRLLGWDISRDLYYKQYVNVDYLDTQAHSIPIVTGYKNVERLKRKMRDHGAQFLKTNEVFDLPAQNFQRINVAPTKDYFKFKKKSILKTHGIELVGDTTLTKMLYERELCGAYNAEKLAAFLDLVQSTDDRLIVFYNFNMELSELWNIAGQLNRHISVVNGQMKQLETYENENNSITLIQYQAGAMGLNLQKANKVIYFSPPLSSELYEQSKKRVHRIGQKKTCFYYNLIVRDSVEEKIYKALEMRRDYTEKLFERGE